MKNFRENRCPASGRSIHASTGVQALAVAALVVLAGLFTGPPAAGDNVLAGSDTWRTPPGAYIDPGLPVDFFDPGSDAFTDRINVMGAPFTQFAGPPLGQIDTIMVRPNDTVALSCGAPPETVTLRIGALHLVNEDPIVVRYGGLNPEVWDLEICLSETFPQPDGTITITQDCADGGSMATFFSVRSKLVFRRQSDGLVRTLEREDGNFAGGGDWVHDPQPVFLPFVINSTVRVDGNCNGIDDDPDLPASSNFYPGLAADGCDDGCTNPEDSPQSLGPELNHETVAANHRASRQPSAIAIPTLGSWSLTLLVLLLVAAGTMVFRGRRAAGGAGR